MVFSQCWCHSPAARSNCVHSCTAFDNFHTKGSSSNVTQLPSDVMNYILRRAFSSYLPMTYRILFLITFLTSVKRPQCRRLRWFRRANWLWVSLSSCTVKRCSLALFSNHCLKHFPRFFCHLTLHLVSAKGKQSCCFSSVLLLWQPNNSGARGTVKAA